MGRLDQLLRMEGREIVPCHRFSNLPRMPPTPITPLSSPQTQAEEKLRPTSRIQTRGAIRESVRVWKWEIPEDLEDAQEQNATSANGDAVRRKRIENHFAAQLRPILAEYIIF